ncbi:MAG: THUMP domain-containing protein [Candidatus Thorarchaeota archaeon]|jgi:tRNA acetyltransferase TAN1
MSEVQYFIGDLLEDTEFRVFRTPISGLIAALTSLNPFEVIHRLREFALENSYQFRFAIRFTPIERCIPTSLEEIVKASEELSTKIGDNDSFRVTVRRRHTDLENMEVVTAAASVIDRQVNLDNPDKTVWIEIVGEWTGVSVLNQNEDILSIMTMRDDMY